MLFEIIANGLSGLFGSFQNLFLFLFILLVYAVANYFWLISLKKGSGLARGTVYFGVGIVLATTLIGIVFYSETLTTFKAIGVALGSISLVLMVKE